MLIHSILKYFILNQCIETMFDKIYYNFQKPDDKIINIIQEIYKIYKAVKKDEGINIGSFEKFYEEQMSMLKYSGNNTYRLLTIQLNILKSKYSEYV